MLARSAPADPRAYSITICSFTSLGRASTARSVPRSSPRKPKASRSRFQIDATEPSSAIDRCTDSVANTALMRTGRRGRYVGANRLTGTNRNNDAAGCQIHDRFPESLRRTGAFEDHIGSPSVSRREISMRFASTDIDRDHAPDTWAAISSFGCRSAATARAQTSSERRDGDHRPDRTGKPSTTGGRSPGAIRLGGGLHADGERLDHQPSAKLTLSGSLNV